MNVVPPLPEASTPHDRAVAFVRDCAEAAKSRQERWDRKS